MKRFYADENGQTLVEFGLFVAVVTLVVIGVVWTMGRKVQTVYSCGNANLTT